MRLRHLRKILTAIAPAEEIFLRPGFRVADTHLRVHFEDMGRAMLHGFREATANETPHDLNNVPAVPQELEGFAWAGAGMGLAVFDGFLPQRPTRIQQLVTRTPSHLFMIHLGVGWAIARMQDFRHHAETYVESADDPLRSIALMGYGAHQAYFHWSRYVENQAVEWRLSPEGRQPFDEGVGCALWLGEGASVERVATRVAEFPVKRQEDLWSGLGFACAYAGAAKSRGLSYLREASGPFLTYLAEGAAMAAHVRHVANNRGPYTDTATRQMCRMDSEQAARVTEEAFSGLSARQGLAGYDTWRNQIRLRFQ